MDATAHDYRMLTSDILRGAVEGDGADRVLTLDPAFQGLPATAHGGSVLAVFDAVAGRTGPHAVHGLYVRRVPLGVPLRLRVRLAADACELDLSDASAVLVTGRVTPADPAAPAAPSPAAPPAPDAPALPISRECFACGTDNPLGLRARLCADDVAVGGTWTPPAGFRAADGMVAAVALTTLLDEAAFWLGALATGESGMTTELRVSLHGPAPFDGALTVTGARASARARPGDARYWDTEIAARDAGGRLVASATITFVAIRGAARRLVAGMLAVNTPEQQRRVFPAYAPPA
jgi:acyl-coenzyme A thioesterase PaaI-like protein